MQDIVLLGYIMLLREMLFLMKGEIKIICKKILPDLHYANLKRF